MRIRKFHFARASSCGDGLDMDLLSFLFISVPDMLCASAVWKRLLQTLCHVRRNMVARRRGKRPPCVMKSAVLVDGRKPLALRCSKKPLLLWPGGA
ncbi:MAG: hypothetical protein LBE33_08870 [Zoogloeaceae bacterium]|jgi:hypothetical protein|nr:hypothetical protein [Zoogloeaceae bacterium]